MSTDARLAHVTAMESVISIEFSGRVLLRALQTVTEELGQVDEIEETSAPPRSAIGATLALVKVAGPVLESVSTALPIVQKVVGLLRGHGISWAKIELPDGTRIEVDKAPAADLERLLRAATGA